MRQVPFVRPARASRRLLAIAVATALVATACSSGDEDPDTTASGSPSAAGSEPSTNPESPSPTPSPTDEVAEVAQEYDLPEAPAAVRGVYSHIYTFWSDKWYHLVDLVETTELNSIVVDVKDEAGTLLWDIDHPMARAGGGGDWRKDFEGLEDRLQALKDAGGWAIARLACFKDTGVAKAHPELAVQNPSGGVWTASKGFAWLNPYKDKAGQYCIDMGKAALELGFDEIQFDYIRFPNGGDGPIEQARFPGVPDDRPRDQWRHSDEIVDFLDTASHQIHEAGGYVSADLFALVSYDFRWDAGGTGQVLERIGEHVDYISPMIYPSHYHPGNYGLMPHPVRHPYETVWNAMQETQMRLQGLRARVRPWLEDFPSPWLDTAPEHTPQRVAEQIRATYENGAEGWLLWNAANNYSESVFDEGETELKANEDFRPPARTANPDAPPGQGKDKQWPGMPPCDPYPGVLQVGEGNLAGSTPPKLALPADDPRLCAGVPDGEEATEHWRDRDVEPSAGASDAPSSGATASDQATE